ncbi:MAG: hypothetical protein K0Q60_4697, partial [Microvirga sp.]|nr:hypothetical protein [Microvirga sp.]
MDESILREITEKLTVDLPTAGRALCDVGRNASWSKMCGRCCFGFRLGPARDSFGTSSGHAVV